MTGPSWSTSRSPRPSATRQLTTLLADVAADPRVRLRVYSSVDELATLVADDLAAMLAEAFASGAAPSAADGGPDAVAPTTPSSPAATLPIATSSLVGREAELAAITRLLGRRDVRLVTVTGMGGIGKSRVALEAAHRLAPTFPGGVVFVPLGEVPEPGLVLSSIAARLGIRLDSARSSIDVVAEALAERGDLLLLLDNAEQVRDAADDLAALVGACGGITLLVTSRSRIRIVAEHDYPLQPLDLGPTVSSEGFVAPAADIEAIERAAAGSAAVRLFLERARASRPDLDLAADPAQLHAVVELCRRLEGLPLAIEIAAARVRLLAPTHLLERLDRRLDLPAARLADLPERQRTLRSTIDWSYELLRPAERELLACLSTFVGGASLAAIEEVVSLEGDLLESLATLADHSLLDVDAVAVDPPRFTMLETVRDYARERLERSGSVAVVDAAHREWVLGLAARAHAALPGPEHAEWLERLELESANIRVAGSRAHAAGDPQTLVDVGFRLWLWLWARHHTREARLWLERALDVPDRLDPLTRARLAWTLAGAGVEQGDNEVAAARLAESTTLFTELGDAEGIALCGFLEASLAPLAGEHDRAIETFARTESQFLALGNVFLASICSSTAGLILAQQGRFDEAQTQLDRGLAQARSIDNAMLLGAAAVSRGFARLGRGALDDAAADLAAGARWAHECKNPETLSFACDGLAAVLLARGTAGEDAAALVGASHGLRDRVGIVPWPGLRPVMAAIADGVRAAVPPEVYDVAHRSGRHLDLDAVLELTTRAAAVQTQDALGG